VGKMAEEKIGEGGESEPLVPETPAVTDSPEVLPAGQPPIAGTSETMVAEATNKRHPVATLLESGSVALMCAFFLSAPSLYGYSDPVWARTFLYLGFAILALRLTFLEQALQLKRRWRIPLLVALWIVCMALPWLADRTIVRRQEVRALPIRFQPAEELTEPRRNFIRHTFIGCREYIEGVGLSTHTPLPEIFVSNGKPGTIGGSGYSVVGPPGAQSNQDRLSIALAGIDNKTEVCASYLWYELFKALQATTDDPLTMTLRNVEALSVYTYLISDFSARHVPGHWDRWSDSFWAIRAVISREFSNSLVVSTIQAIANDKSVPSPIGAKENIESYKDKIMRGYVMGALSATDDIKETHRKTVEAIIASYGGN
jgi:hypothetical protein